MNVRSLADAVAYVAPKHNGCSSFRMQGLDASEIKDFWIGISHFLPGGGAETDASPFAKVYVVTAGAVTLAANGETVVLREHDSCLIPAHETRTVRNDSHLPATMVVVISRHAEPA